MPLPWVRLDSNIGTHDKVLALLAQRDGAKAFVLFICALGYAGAHETDGRIPPWALTVNHGTAKLARLLIDHEFWDYHPDGPSAGYLIRNWSTRQQTADVTEAIRSAQSEGGRKANCIRWHGPDCGCWKTYSLRSLNGSPQRSQNRSVDRSVDRSVT